jgi:hypothetical protein
MGREQLDSTERSDPKLRAGAAKILADDAL